MFNTVAPLKTCTRSLVYAIFYIVVYFNTVVGLLLRIEDQLFEQIYMFVCLLDE